jgi:16S rRNA (cytosine967-C5)-methyltransferase
MPGAREVALAVLARVEGEGAFAAAALEAELEQTRDLRDRALATELVLGCLRRQSWLDHLLESAATRGLAGIDPTVRRILRVAVYQLAFLERVPPRAAVSEAVDQARRSRAPGLAKLVNGLLRNLSSRDRSSLLPDGDAPGTTDELAQRLGVQRTFPTHAAGQHHPQQPRHRDRGARRFGGAGRAHALVGRRRRP